MKLLFFSLLVFAFTPAFSQDIMDCSLNSGNGADNLFVYLTDTSGVYGFNIKIGTVFDDNNLLSEQYVLAALPGNATLIENTFSVSLDEMSGSPKYVWVKMLLSGGGAKEIKVTAD